MPPFGRWDDVAAFALTLPETAIEKFYNGVAVKVGGKAPRKAFGERP